MAIKSSLHVSVPIVKRFSAEKSRQNCTVTKMAVFRENRGLNIDVFCVKVSVGAIGWARGKT